MSDRITTARPWMCPSPSPRPGPRAQDEGGPAPVWPEQHLVAGLRLVPNSTGSSPRPRPITTPSRAPSTPCLGGGCGRTGGGRRAAAERSQPRRARASPRSMRATAAGAAMARSPESDGTVTQIGQGIVDTRTYSAELSASYEIDFWGKNLATFKAAEASAVAARYRRAGHRSHHRRARSRIPGSRPSPIRTSWRWPGVTSPPPPGSAECRASAARTAGTASILDVAQQAALVAGQRANVPDLVSLEKQEVIALGILVGRPPEDIAINAGTLVTIPSPAVVPGLPIDLLQSDAPMWRKPRPRWSPPSPARAPPARRSFHRSR